MKERNITFLLQKYETKQPGEHTTNKEISMKNWRLKQKIRITQNIMNRLNIQGNNRKMCLNIIKNIRLKDLHHNAKCETIITAICFYIKKTENTNVKLEDYSVCTEYDLNYQTFSLVMCRLCDYYRKNSYMK